MTIKFEYRCLTADGLKDPSGQHHRYLILDKTGREYGYFRLIEAPFLRPVAGCKHMELQINAETLIEIEDKGNISLLLSIFYFVFNSVLEITHLKGYKLAKLYSNERILADIYQQFADKLNKEQYDVKFYRNWVEIRRKK